MSEEAEVILETCRYCNDGFAEGEDPDGNKLIGVCNVCKGTCEVEVEE